MPGALHIGIDISGRENMACFLNENGDKLGSVFAFCNDQTGLTQFLEKLFHIADSHSPEKINIGMEATNFYWWHLQEALSEVRFEGADIDIFIINPKLVKGFKRAYPNLPKTDAIDAFVIADRLRFGRLTPVHRGSLIYAPLARITRLRYMMKKSIEREKNRAINLTFLKFSNFRQAAGRKAFNKSSCELLNEFTVDEVAGKPLEELVDFVLAHGNNRITSPEEFINEIQKAANNSYRLNPKMNDMVSVALTMTIENIRFLESQCKKLDKVIEKEFAAMPQVLNTIPGIGKVLSAGITTEIGDISRLSGEKALAKFAGLTWHRTQSGPFVAEETSLTKAGNAYLRYYLVEAANSLRLHNDDYAAYYQRKYNEVTKHQHKRALVLTARKFVRLVFALLSKGQIYNERMVNG